MNCRNNSNRIFTDLKNTYDDNQVIIDYVKSEIVEKLLDPNCTSRSDNSGIDAGYTYLGQMIAHDIVPSTNLHIERPVSPKLDLDSLYNENNFSSCELFDDDGKFILGKAKCVKSDDFINDSDLLRINGKARIPDPRNDENIIISQLHLLWLKLHNKIVSEITPLPLGKVDTIKLVRKVVTYTFNRIILDDYLKKILESNVYTLYKNGLQLFYDDTLDITEIPIEFSRAAFRFGHSMVRESYDINREVNDGFNLLDLFLRSPIHITDDKVVYWKRFFDYKTRYPTTINITTDSAFRIDTRITCAMYQAPFGSTNKDIRDINLEANLDISYEMPTGLQIYNILSGLKEFKPLFSDNIKIYKEINKLKYDIPLWPYILLEAEKNTHGKLGLIGSIIIAEVIMISSKSALRRLDINAMDNYVIDIGLLNSGEKLTMKHLLEYLEL